MRSERLSFGILACLLLACFIALWLLPNWNHNIPAFLAIYFFAFAFYILATNLALRGSWDGIPQLSTYIFVLAVAYRLMIFWTPPYLSGDIYRYVWDGRAQLAGFGPYDYPPDAKEVAFLRDENFPHMTYTWLRTNYPPAVETIFHLLALPRSFSLFKLGILGFDFLLMEILRRLLLREKLPPVLLLIYAWHPLPVIEFAGSAHMDVIGISLFLTSYFLISRSWNATAGCSLALAVLTKYIPIFSLPWMVPKGGWKFVALLLLTMVAVTLPFYTSDLRMLEGLIYYYRKWRFNDSLFGVLYVWLGGAEPARRAGLIAVLASTAFCWIKRYSFYRSLLIIFGTIILFSPVVHPWYVCWLIPFLVFHRNRAWQFFTGWIALAYLIIHFYPGGVWKNVLWLKLLIYIPLFAALLVEWIISRSTNREALQASVSSSRTEPSQSGDRATDKIEPQKVGPERQQ